MAPQVFGSPREDKATHGEQQVYKHLASYLPKEYSVYVECPLHDKRQLRYPDFIVSTNYGVVVLEVKDWVEVVKADKYQVTIRTRGNKLRTERNPVDSAKEYAILLNQELQRVSGPKKKTIIPWGYAVVLPNLPTSVVTQLRRAWGDEFVLNLHDLQPNIITNRLRNTLPAHHIRSLRKEEMDHVRATINPVVLIEEPDRQVILDVEQERIVTEAVKEVPKEKAPETPKPEQLGLTGLTEVALVFQPGEETLPDYELEISRNASVRLVRGIAGSGKSLVLAQRARYLAAQYPEWNILVLTFNKELRHDLQSRLKGFKVKNFHDLCKLLLAERRPWKPVTSEGWLKNHQGKYPLIEELGSEYIVAEIEWIKDMHITNLSEYQEAERKGRKRQMGAVQRENFFTILQDYQAYLDKQGAFDWADIPHLILDEIARGEIECPPYDAILIDEAQDFAPGWFKLINALLNPMGGVIFLADDPAQSIYRHYSWREKGIHVVGRTRWLRVPYRNTHEIYQAAYQMISTDEGLVKALIEEGVFATPDLEDISMRHGPRPLLQKFNRVTDELESIREKIFGLIQDGIDPGQIAVLHRRKSGVTQLKKALQGTGVHLNTFHAYKGMEFEVVFLIQLQETQVKDELPEEAHQKERRLVYMAMTRAREKLFLSYTGNLPRMYNALDTYVDQVI